MYNLANGQPKTTTTQNSSLPQWAQTILIKFTCEQTTFLVCNFNPAMSYFLPCPEMISKTRKKIIDIFISLISFGETRNRARIECVLWISVYGESWLYICWKLQPFTNDSIYRNDDDDIRTMFFPASATIHFHFDWKSKWAILLGWLSRCHFYSAQKIKSKTCEHLEMLSLARSRAVRQSVRERKRDSELYLHHL